MRLTYVLITLSVVLLCSCMTELASVESKVNRLKLDNYEVFAVEEMMNVFDARSFVEKRVLQSMTATRHSSGIVGVEYSVVFSERVCVIGHSRNAWNDIFKQQSSCKVDDNTFLDLMNTHVHYFVNDSGESAWSVSMVLARRLTGGGWNADYIILDTSTSVSRLWSEVSGASVDR